MTAEDVAFLARAPNRAAVLRALVEEPSSRGELRDRVGASRVTVGRITTDLASRGWVERTEGTYRATTAGREVSRAYERFVDTVETTRRLDPLIEFLPTEAFEFELTALADADVVVPTPTAPGKHLARLQDLFADSGEVRMVVHAIVPRIVAANHEAAHGSDQVARGVVTPEVTESIRADPAVRERIRATHERGGLVLYERPSVPFQVATFDDVAIISADDETGVPRGIVVTGSPVVREWVVDAFDRLRADATELGPEAFAAPSEGEDSGGGIADRSPGSDPVR